MNSPIRTIRLLSMCLVCLGFGLGNAQATDNVTNPEAADVAAETPAESASTTSQPVTRQQPPRRTSQRLGRQRNRPPSEA